MNKERRATIAKLAARIDDIKAELETVREELETVRDEEQEAYDNMPESFQDGERGERAQESIDALETAVSELEGFDFDSVTDSLETARA